MSDLKKWFAEYVELMYPDDKTIATSSQHELEGMAHTARVRACWIVEQLIDSGQHRSLS